MFVTSLRKKLRQSKSTHLSKEQNMSQHCVKPLNRFSACRSTVHLHSTHSAKNKTFKSAVRKSSQNWTRQDWKKYAAISNKTSFFFFFLRLDMQGQNFASATSIHQLNLSCVNSLWLPVVLKCCRVCFWNIFTGFYATDSHPSGLFCWPCASFYCPNSPPPEVDGKLE